MNIIVDTRILLWILNEPDKLSAAAKRVLLEGSPLVFVSAATIWELAIKEAAGKMKLSYDIADIVIKSGFQNLDITAAHAKLAGKLPKHHHDPFDRMLVAQAICEDFHLMTHDATLKKYKAKILFV